jgi:uncharacterized membrane protein HdeD (DUF308 family)
METSANPPVRRRSIITTPGAGDTGMSATLAQNWWAVALRGVAAILFGLFALFAPGAVLLSLALFFAAYLLADGIFGIVSAVRAARRHERWGLLLAEGVLSILVGVAALLFPVGAVLAFVLMTAGWALATGVLMLVAAYKLEKTHGRGWMVLSGVVSILFGLALAVAPLAGAVVLAWWFAGYAIAFGTLMLGLAFKLRGHKTEASRSAAGGIAPTADADRTRVEVERSTDRALRPDGTTGTGGL